MINEKKVITIIGAGNVGTAMTAILSQNKELRVIVYSSKKEQWCKELKYRVMDIDKWNVIEGYEVTDNLEYAVINSNQIFITLPSFDLKLFIFICIVTLLSDKDTILNKYISFLLFNFL